MCLELRQVRFRSTATNRTPTEGSQEEAGIRDTKVGRSLSVTRSNGRPAGRESGFHLAADR